MSARAEKVETSRVEAFSDSVFAIAITLLGLELKVPILRGTSLAASLVAGWPSYVAFFTSFVTITIIWINHHRLFTHIFRIDHVLLLLNALLLMVVTIVPFGTAILADYITRAGEQRMAILLYNGTFIALTGAFNLLWRHAARHHRLLDHGVDRPTIRRINLQYGFGPVLYGVSCGLSLLTPWAGVGADLLLVLLFALPVLSWSAARPGEVAADPDAPVRAPPTAVGRSEAWVVSEPEGRGTDRAAHQ